MQVQATCTMVTPFIMYAQPTAIPKRKRGFTEEGKTRLRNPPPIVQDKAQRRPRNISA